MREKVREYISELDTEIDRLDDLLKNTDSPYDLQIKDKLNAIIEVKNDFLEDWKRWYKWIKIAI